MTCTKCGWWEKICKCGNSNIPFHISKDGLWNFTDINITGKPIEIRSKGQWNRLLKKHGIHDDISTRSIETISKNHERNRNEEQKRELHKTLVNVYKEVRRG